MKYQNNIDDELPLKEWLREIRLEKIDQKKKRENMKKLKIIKTMSLLMLIPLMSYASVESMMNNLQSVILNVLAPVLCFGGIIFSGFKLAMGDESAKRMLFWSCIGTVIAFTAPSILSFLQNRIAG